MQQQQGASNQQQRLHSSQRDQDQTVERAGDKRGAQDSQHGADAKRQQVRNSLEHDGDRQQRSSSHSSSAGRPSPPDDRRQSDQQQATAAEPGIPPPPPLLKGTADETSPGAAKAAVLSPAQAAAGEAGEPSLADQDHTATEAPGSDARTLINELRT